jgi:hypothetical protein
MPDARPMTGKVVMVTGGTSAVGLSEPLTTAIPRGWPFSADRTGGLAYEASDKVGLVAIALLIALFGLALLVYR